MIPWHFVLAMEMESHAPPTALGILGQDPATVEQTLGPYWSKLTVRLGGIDRHITYTYNPQRLRPLFLHSDPLTLAVDFVNHRADRIRIGQGFDIPPGQLDSPDFYPSAFDGVYAALFGTPVAATDPHYRQRIQDDEGEGGTFHTTTFCLGGGIALTYEWISSRSFVNYLDLQRSEACGSLSAFPVGLSCRRSLKPTIQKPCPRVSLGTSLRPQTP
ncbi:hypothetical protein [Prochlorothrix hollandica]|uniref:Uncharacterized protein n=1 Tax=Prochlorothrix hollandica PCC 9006 = CALU 1027 TaxID=317619 RepID=A0A0M2Q1A0_PROHO|nr:hypothetical protein [Prochlorothrix hollandica]KKJ01083.1 hypothetical protein PROH_01380 [Prochlorothrix hollandica PCC 9006 = CALU 1027]